MITATATPTATQPRRTAKMTVDEYLALDELEGVWELIDGLLTKMASPSAAHQHLMGLLYRMIDTYPMATSPASGIVLFRVAIALSKFRVAVPDLVYVRAGREYLLRGPVVSGAPDLVVEILSQDRAKDLIRNRQWYAQAGIPEYWIMDPVHDTLMVLELSAGQYRERAVLTAQDTLTTPTIPGLTIPLTEIFDDPKRAQIR